MLPPLRCDWSNCGRDRQSHLYGRHCKEHTCEECWNGRIAGCMYCADHKCTWPGPKGCQSYKDDEDTYCTDHARVDWSCQWSDSTCPSPRIIDFEVESGYCFARHKCSISDCPWRIKRGGRYCAEDHACMQPDCVKEATASGCCEACQCPWPGCRYPKTEESGLCAHHDCPCGNELKRSDEEVCIVCFREENCAHPDCGDGEGSVCCLEHECRNEDCEKMVDPDVEGSIYCKLHRCIEEDCWRPRNDNTDCVDIEMQFCELHGCTTEDCPGRRKDNPEFADLEMRFCDWCCCKAEDCTEKGDNDIDEESLRGLCYRHWRLEVNRDLEAD